MDKIINGCQIQAYWVPESSNIFERLIVIKKNLLSSDSHLLVQPTTHSKRPFLIYLAVNWVERSRLRRAIRLRTFFPIGIFMNQQKKFDDSREIGDRKMVARQPAEEDDITYNSWIASEKRRNSWPQKGGQQTFYLLILSSKSEGNISKC